MNLPKGSVETWADLCDQFVSAFDGRFKCLGTMADLQAIIQKPRGMLHSFMQQFCQVSHSIPDVEEASIIATFFANIRDAKMWEKTNTRRLTMTNELYTLADKCTQVEEGRLAPELAAKAAADLETSTKKKVSRKRGSRQVLAAELGTSAGSEKKAKTEVAVAKPAAGPWCPIHALSSHDACDCRSV
jgi:hypothetical protein